MQVDELRAKQAAILAREKQEIAAAAGNTMFASMLPAYRLRIKWQLDEAQQQVKAHEGVLEGIRVKLQEAYVEKSKFEQLIEQETKRVSTERATREQAMLDEVAINRAGALGK